MTYEKVKNLNPEEFKCFCGVKSERFIAFLILPNMRRKQSPRLHFYYFLDYLNYI
jgi:hypothetical protein